MLNDQTVLDDAAADEMLLDDALEHRRIALTVPSAFWVHHRDRSAFADPQAVRLRAQNPALLRQPELFEPSLQEVPRSQPAIFFAALRRRLIAAEEDVPPRHRNADARCDGTLGI